jgi:hypothetical protein
MKATPSEARLRQRFEPGVLGREGFLGTDLRAVADIVAADEAILATAGLTARQVGELLQRIFEAAEAAIETRVSLGGGSVTAQMVEGMGRISCPFACGARSRKGELTIEFGTQSLLLTPLSIHLIREHGFFQGRGSRYRLEPATAAELWHAGAPGCWPPGRTVP